MANVVAIVPDTDTTGHITYDSDIPYLGVQIFDTVSNNAGVTVYSGSKASSEFVYDLNAVPPSNSLLTVGISNLAPNTETTLYAVPFSGLTYANVIISTESLLYVTDDFVQFAVGETPLSVSATSRVPSTLTNLKYSKGNYYACGEGASNITNFGFSDNGVFWNTDAKNPYLTDVYDIAFDSRGMGVAVGLGDDYCISLLMQNKVWMPVLDSKDMFYNDGLKRIDPPKLIINAKRWYAVSDYGLYQSYNGITWSDMSNSFTGLTFADGSLFNKETNILTPVASDYDATTDLLIIASQGFLFKIQGGVLTLMNKVGNLASGAITEITDLKFNGSYWLLSGIGSDQEFSYNLVKFTSSDFSTIGSLTSNSFGYTGGVSSIAWYNNLWYSIRENGDIARFSISDSNKTAVADNKPALTTSLGIKPKILPRVESPYGGALSTDSDPGITGITQFLEAPAQYTYGETLTFQPVLPKNSARPYCNQEVSYKSPTILNSFDLTFTTDIYSPKDIICKDILGNSFNFRILESSNENPYVFTSDSNQSGNAVYDFINDGVLYSDLYNSGRVYSVQIDNLEQIKDFTDNPDTPIDVDQEIVDNQNIIRNKFYGGTTLANSNNLFNYNTSDIRTIYNFENVSNPGVLKGSTSYNYKDLGEAISRAEVSNISTLNSAFPDYCVNTGSIAYPHPFLDPDLEEQFPLAITNTLNGITGIVHLDQSLKNQFYDATRSFSTLETYLTTEYIENSHTSVNFNNFKDAFKLIYDDNEITRLRSIIDRYKKPVINRPKYTSKSVFRVLFDGQFLSYYVDNVLIQQFLVNKDLNLTITFDPFNNEYNSGHIVRYKPTITFNITNIVSPHQQLKELVKHKFNRLQYPKKVNYDYNIVLSSYLNVGVNYHQPVSVPTVTVPFNRNNYYYLISQYSNDIKLTQYCLNNISTTIDPYPGTTIGSLETDYSNIFLSNEGTTGNCVGLCIQNLLAECASDFAVGNSYSAPSPTPNYTFNRYYKEAYDKIVNNDHILNSFVLFDHIFLYRCVSVLHKFLCMSKVLTAYPSVINDRLPVLPSKNILQVINDDLINTYRTSSILNKLGGKLILNKENIFNSQTIFTNTSSTATKSFLNAIETLSDRLGDKSLYSKAFALVTDELEINGVVNRILRQRLSNIEISKDFLYNLSQPVGIAGYYNGKQYRSNYLVNTIWDHFYGFSNAFIKVISSSNVITSYKLDSSSYVNNYRYVVPGSILVLGEGREIPAPITRTLSLLGIKFGQPLPTSDLHLTTIFDPAFNDTMLNYFSQNYMGPFPSSMMNGFSDWVPMNDLLSDDVYTGSSYLSILMLARIYGNGTLLTQEAYTRDRNEYTALSLPIQSTLDDNILQEFTEKFLPEVESFILKLFRLDLGNETYFLTLEQDSLYKQFLTLGNYATDYAGITSASSTYNPNHYVDINRIYKDLSISYEEQVSNSVKIQFDNAGLTTISNLTAYVNTFVNNTNPLLLSFNNSLNKLTTLSTFYNGAFKSQFSYWKGNLENYNDLIDSIKRYKALSDDITSNQPPDYTVNPTFTTSNFIVSIPPYDTNRWKEVTGIPVYRCSRYNPYWRYYFNDIVGFNGKVYQCYDTARDYSVKGVPPGGYTQYVSGLNTVSISLNVGASGPTGSIGATGPSLQSWYNYPTLSNLNKPLDLNANPNADIEPLLAWEEWRDIPENIYPGIDPGTAKTNEKFTYKELNYVLTSNNDSFPRITEDWNPSAVYYQGDLVKYHNTIYRCKGGSLINRNIGIGIPPGFFDTGKSWALVYGKDNSETPGSNGAWASYVPGITSLNINNYLNPREINSKYLSNQTLPELNHLNSYVNPPDYKPDVAYNLGDVVNYNDKLYVCLYNGTIKNQAGATGYIINIPPPSELTERADSIWIAQPYFDLSTDGKDIPTFNSEKSYNYGDLVVYNNLVYKFSVRVINTYGATTASVDTYIPELYAFYGVTLSGGPSGTTYSPGIFSFFGITLNSSNYNGGGATSGTRTYGSVVEQFTAAGITYIPGYTLTTINTYYIGSTGAPPLNKSVVYNKGDLVSYYGDFVFKSLKDNNIDEPADPNFLFKDSIYWAFEGAIRGINAVEIPENTTEYSPLIDYNLTYHTLGYSDLYVIYDGALWRWNYNRQLDYSNPAPEMSELLQQGVVYQIPPPLPSPFNPWLVLDVDPNIQINPFNKELITEFSLNITYAAYDIVRYKGFLFVCTAKGFGSSVIDNVGSSVPTQLYIPEKEVSSGRLINSDTNIRYLETIISTDGVNWKDITKPKWGSGYLFDKWGKTGFAKDLRYNFASGLELTYVALKHDLSVRNQIVVGNFDSSLTSRIKSDYQFSLTTTLLNTEVNSLPSNLDNHFKSCEFYYYSNLVKHVNELIPAMNTYEQSISKAYGIWKNYHSQIYKEVLVNIISRKNAYPSLTGEPLFVRTQNLEPIMELGFVTIAQNDTVNIRLIINAVKLIGDSLTNYYFTRDPDRSRITNAGLTLTTYPNGVRAINPENYSDDRYWDFLLNEYLVTAAFYHKETGQRYYGSGGTGSTLPWIPPDKSQYYYFDIQTFENAGAQDYSTVPITNLIAGWRDLYDEVDIKKSSSKSLVASTYASIAHDLLGSMVDNGIGYNPQTKELDFGQGNSESLYRQHIFMQTGYDDVIALPIFTRKDREILGLSITNGWTTRNNKNFKNNTFNGWKNVNARWPSQPSPETEYLTERTLFDSFPNLFLYHDVKDALKAIAGITISSELIDDTKVVRAIRTAQLTRLLAGVTGRENFLNSTDYTIWQPWGQIQDNADFSSPAPGQAGYDVNNYTNSGDVTYRSPDSIYRNTRYERPNHQLKNDQQLFIEQGKHVITKDKWYTCLIPYFLHLKMVLEKENKEVLPDSVAIDAKTYFTDQCQAVYTTNYRNTIRVLFVLAIAFITLAISIATFMTGGIAAPVAAFVLGIIMTTLAVVPGRADINLAVTDPGALLIPEIRSAEGLAVRCAVMDTIANILSDKSYDGSNKENSLISNIPKPSFAPITYHEYVYAFDYHSDLINTIIPAAIINNRGKPFDRLDGLIFAKISALSQGWDEGSPEYEAYADSLGLTGQSYLDVNHPDVRLEMENADIQITRIDTYEQELFHPIILGYQRINRDAKILIKDVVLTNIKNERSLYSTLPSSYIPPTDATYKLIISINDPGEGFFAYDEIGKQVALSKEILAGSTLTSNIIVTNNIEVEGRYLYDSFNPASSSVFGLAKFAHEGEVTYNEIEVKIINISPKDLIGTIIRYSPPTYNILASQDTVLSVTPSIFQDYTYINLFNELSDTTRYTINVLNRNFITKNPFLRLNYPLTPSGKQISRLGPAIAPTSTSTSVSGTINTKNNLEPDIPPSVEDSEPSETFPGISIPSPSSRVLSSRQRTPGPGTNYIFNNSLLEEYFSLFSTIFKDNPVLISRLRSLTPENFQLFMQEYILQAYFDTENAFNAMITDRASRLVFSKKQQEEMRRNLFILYGQIGTTTFTLTASALTALKSITYLENILSASLGYVSAVSGVAAALIDDALTNKIGTNSGALVKPATGSISGVDLGPNTKGLIPSTKSGNNLAVRIDDAITDIGTNRPQVKTTGTTNISTADDVLTERLRVKDPFLTVSSRNIISSENVVNYKTGVVSMIQTFITKGVETFADGAVKAFTITERVVSIYRAALTSATRIINKIVLVPPPKPAIIAAQTLDAAENLTKTGGTAITAVAKSLNPFLNLAALTPAAQAARLRAAQIQAKGGNSAVANAYGRAINELTADTGKTTGSFDAETKAKMASKGIDVSDGTKVLGTGVTIEGGGNPLYTGPFKPKPPPRPVGFIQSVASAAVFKTNAAVRRLSTALGLDPPNPFKLKVGQIEQIVTDAVEVLAYAPPRAVPVSAKAANLDIARSLEAYRSTPIASVVEDLNTRTIKIPDDAVKTPPNPQPFGSKPRGIKPPGTEGAAAASAAAKTSTSIGSQVLSTAFKALTVIGVIGDVVSLAMAIVQVVEILKTKPRAIDCTDIANGRS